MTCIVAIEHDGHVYMGGDSALSDGSTILKLVDPKVFRIGDMLIGYCGSPRIGQLLQHALVLPVHNDEKSDSAYLVTDVMDAVRTLLHAKGVLKKENDVEEMEDSGFLVGYRGKIYAVDTDLQVCHTSVGYCSYGCGSQYAMGSLHTTEALAGDVYEPLTPLKRIELALHAATAFSPGCVGPYTLLTLEPHKPVKKTKKKAGA